MDSNAVALLAAQRRFLTERFRIFLEALPPALLPDVTAALHSEGKLLSVSHDEPSSLQEDLSTGSWPLLTFLVAKSVYPDVDLAYASNVALATECLVCAIDLFDDIIDEDQTTIVGALGVPRVVNVASALMLVAQQALLATAQTGVASETVLRLLSLLQQYGLRCIAGQHQDLLTESRPFQGFNSKEAVNIAAAKSGSLMSLACCLGAFCAGADEALCTLFTEFGRLLGIANQLDNDSHDLYHLLERRPSLGEEAEARARKSDLARGKKTLPLVLAAGMRNTLQHASLSSGQEENEEYIRALHEAVSVSWGISLLYREHARSCLEKIEAHRPVAPELRLLLGFD